MKSNEFPTEKLIRVDVSYVNGFERRGIAALAFVGLCHRDEKNRKTV